MRLPEVELDDRTFQSLVSEARMRIHQSCPEWTEHNVSDPGVTLIELFAWMTEMVIYRLNRVPDKLHVAMLDLLAIRRESPTAATTDLTFRLSAPASEPLPIPAGDTEVGTLRTASEEAVVFQTSEDVTIPAARPIAYAIGRGQAIKDVGVAAGVARPKGPDQLPFAMPPAVGDALYLGFDESLSRLLLQVDVDCTRARGPGVDPEDPPLRWEVSANVAGGWVEAAVLRDDTGGFNYGSGVVELELPGGHAATSVAGQRAYWLRCRLDATTRSGLDAHNAFAHPPEIHSVTAAPIGAIISATHAQQELGEVLGHSDGTPGQILQLASAPVLELDLTLEALEVVDPQTGAASRWQWVESFVESRPTDQHFSIDLANGQVELGPAVRSADGGWRQYGAIPVKGALLRFTRYRHGGGRRGNVAGGTLTVLKSAIPGVASVVNQTMAFGGVDLETMDSTRQRAAMEIRTRYRAVTAEDFEFLCGEASPRVARAICLPPRESMAARVHIVPRVEPADRRLAVHELLPDDPLLQEVSEYLDERRLIGTSVELLPARFRGVTIVCNVQAAPRADLTRVEQDVTHALYTYLNPLTGGSLEGIGTGWEFGRALNQGELYGLVHGVEGVDFVKILRVYETNLDTGEQEAKQAGNHLPLEPDELIASGQHIVKADHREL